MSATQQEEQSELMKFLSTPSVMIVCWDVLLAVPLSWLGTAILRYLVPSYGPATYRTVFVIFNVCILASWWLQLLEYSVEAAMIGDLVERIDKLERLLEAEGKKDDDEYYRNLAKWLSDLDHYNTRQQMKRRAARKDKHD